MKKGVAMSQKEAIEFIDRVKADSAFGDRLLTFIREEGYSCSLNEIRAAAWDSMMKRANVEVSNPYSSRASGYEHWAG
jgi:hypothetical protein